MRLSEDIWLGSVAARNNLMAAANYTAAFYGNAAVQSWSLGVTAPQVFWSAMARAFDRTADNSDEAPKRTETETPPVLGVIETPEPAPVPEPVLDRVETASAPQPVEDTSVEALPEDAGSNPLLLDEPRGGVADDLSLIKGIGDKMAAGLNDIGIYHFDQIAKLDEAAIDWLDDHLPGFKRSCARFYLVAGAAGFA